MCSKKSQTMEMVNNDLTKFSNYIVMSKKIINFGIDFGVAWICIAMGKILRSFFKHISVLNNKLIIVN